MGLSRGPISGRRVIIALLERISIGSRGGEVTREVANLGTSVAALPCLSGLPRVLTFPCPSSRACVPLALSASSAGVARSYLDASCPSTLGNSDYQTEAVTICGTPCRRFLQTSVGLAGDKVPLEVGHRVAVSTTSQDELFFQAQQRGCLYQVLRPLS